MVVFKSNTAQLQKHHLFLFKTRDRDGLNLRVGCWTMQKVMGWQTGGEREEMLNLAFWLRLLYNRKYRTKLKCCREQEQEDICIPGEYWCRKVGEKGCFPLFLIKVLKFGSCSPLSVKHKHAIAFSGSVCTIWESTLHHRPWSTALHFLHFWKPV